MRTEKGTGTDDELCSAERRTTENRWCEKYGYIIDVDACRARALQRRSCCLCLARWRQLPLPFPEPW